MFNSHILLFPFVISYLTIAVAVTTYENYKVYSVQANDENDLDFLRNLERNMKGVDFWDRVHHITNSSYRIMVQPEVDGNFTSLLAQKNIMFQLIIDNVQNVLLQEPVMRSRKRSSDKFHYDHFWTYDEVNAYLDDLANKCSGYVRVTSIGKTLEGREMREILISGDKMLDNPNRPTVLVDAGIHAREWIAPMFAVHLIHELVENRNENLDLLRNLNWAIVPIVNPDGYVFSHKHDRFWRKNRKLDTATNCYGVDLNRNFDYHWDAPDGSSDNPCSEIYRGKHSNSEPEVDNLSKFIKKYKNAKLYLTFHSYGGYFLFPFGYAVVMTKNYEELQKLGKLGAEAIYKFDKYRYKVGNSAKMLYPASGGSDDYAIGVANVPLAYTIELPGGGKKGFDIEVSKINNVVRETFGGIQAIGRYIVDKNKRKCS